MKPKLTNEVFRYSFFFLIYFETLAQSINEKRGPGGVFAIPRLKSLSPAKHCVECGNSFGLFRAKYSCINCGYVVCASCSTNRRSLPKFGYNNPVRCCDTCNTFIQMQQMNSSGLMSMPLKLLKSYINAYHLPMRSAIEKEDLVRIILTTRPISNESESYYRAHRTIHSNSKADERRESSEKSKEFPFVQMLSDIFSSSSSGGDSRQERQQAQQTQQARTQQPRPQRQQQQQQAPPPQSNPSSRFPRAYPQPQQSSSTPTRSTAPRPPPTARPTTPDHASSTTHSVPSPSSSQTARSPHAVRKEDVLSLDDLVRSNIDPTTLSVRTLKAILRANFVEQSHALEKSDLIASVQRLVAHRKEELRMRDNPNGLSINDDLLCRICCDAQQNCVFLDCGHMVTCMDCGKQLIATKNECPICREPILKLVHVFRS